MKACWRRSCPSRRASSSLRSWAAKICDSRPSNLSRVLSRLSKRPGRNFEKKVDRSIENLILYLMANDEGIQAREQGIGNRDSDGG